MDINQYRRIMDLADNEQFLDLQYANQLISSLCKELEEKNSLVDGLYKQIKHRPVTYPHHCYLVSSKFNIDEFYLFTQKYEAEMFRLTHKNPMDYQVKTIELFETHKKALLRKDYDFLKNSRV